VTVDELVLMVDIVLGTTAVSNCEAGDVNRDGRISVDEVILAVASALNGCPATVASPTPSLGPLRQSS